MCPEDPEYEAAARRISLISILVNIALSLFKLLAGLIGHSAAMVSDAVHSASDVIGGLIVIVGVRLSGRASDEDHPYGHERLECVASIILSAILFLAGGGIGYTALTDITTGAAQTAPVPGRIALIAALVSILVKECLFQATRRTADRIHSIALKAEAWHQRSDALSSIGALIGIAGARLGLRMLDPIAGILICLMIWKSALDIFRDAVDRMVDHACPPEFEQNLREFVLAQRGVRGIDLLQTREFGRKTYVDLEIRVDGNMPLRDAHEIAEQVHAALERQYPEIKHVMIHVNPG
ncbi:MAG: cation transporter [Clostridia bacterium]|nr:cation transporter [Clostridia bacterium]